MAETTRTTSTMQEQVLETLRAGQDASVKIVRSWAETVASLSRPVVGDNVDTLFRFGQQVWDSQREYAIQLLLALEPVARVPTPRAPGAPEGRPAAAKA
jgi:hypothetical protein